MIDPLHTDDRAKFARRLLRQMPSPAKDTQELKTVARDAACVELAGDLMDRNELAGWLKLSAKTVHRMVRRGELPRPCLSDGGRPRWLRSHVLTYLQERHRRLDRVVQRKNKKLQSGGN